MNRETIRGVLTSREGADADAIREAMRQLDEGRLRAAEPTPDGWLVRLAELKPILLAYFRQHAGDRYPTRGDSWAAAMEYGDAMPLKRRRPRDVVVSPGAIVRYGAHVSPGAYLLPCQVGVGAWIGPDTMVDTFASVGTCAQIGAGVHLAQHVSIGGVFEPEQDRPVIVEDHCFIGSSCSVTEGVIVRERAVLAAGVHLTASVPIIDVTGPEPVEHRGEVPAGAVVVPGARPGGFSAGQYQVACALILGWRGERTEARVALNEAARRALAGLPVPATVLA
jgi:2,3,4,5-tetrahydropyridine-2-carboxylate N-succinyltransferase